MLTRMIAILVVLAGASREARVDEVKQEQTVAENGLAARYPGDVGIEKDKSVIFASGFENGFRGWSSRNQKVSSIVRDTKIIHSGDACCQMTATRGRDTGGNVLFRLPKGVEQLYLRYLDERTDKSAWAATQAEIHKWVAGRQARK